MVDKMIGRCIVEGCIIQVNNEKMCVVVIDQCILYKLYGCII